MARLATVLTLVVLGACFAPTSADPEVKITGGRDAVAEDPAQKARNEDVMNRLAPSCASCHAADSNKPFFASLDAFETLLVFEPRFVTPGNPDASELVRLLEATSSGPFRQMPIGSDAFAQLAEAGKTQIGMTEIRAWIHELNGAVTMAPGARESVVMQRLDAEHVLAALGTQLGLSDDDFWTLDGNGVPVEAKVSRYPARAPDALPMNTAAIGHSDTPEAAWGRYTALGGAHRLGRLRKRSELSPTFALHFIQSSQAWCARAVEKNQDDLLLGGLTPGDTSELAAPAIRANLARLYLRMIGDPPSEAEIDDLYGSVYLAYEPQGVAVAWTATCTAILRNPRWLLY